MAGWDWPVPLKCYQCGCDIYMSVSKREWAFKRDFCMHDSRNRLREKFFCSWKCMRAYDREIEEKKMQKIGVTNE